MSTKLVISFVLGVVVGAAAALLLAPKSGEDLRLELRQEAVAERERLQKEYAQAQEQLHQRVDKMQSEVHERLEQVKERGETAVN